MWTIVTHETKRPTDYQLRRVTIDLTREDIRQETVHCQDLDDFLGGIARSFKLLAHYEVQDAFAPSAPLIMNLGVFSGTDLMTGLRIFFSAYSPLKVANNGCPLAMWSAASDKFGTKVRAAGVDEVIFLGRAQRPVYLLIHRDDTNELALSLEAADDLLGKTTHAKIMQLADRHPDSHVAALGPAGEHWQQNFYAAIACSTVNQLRSRDCKPRFAGRGGMGSIMGSKNLIAIVAQAPDIHRGKSTPALLDANKEISRGPGSRNYRDADKGNGNGGTWRNVAGLHPIGALPEMNFWPQGNDRPVALYRNTMESNNEYFIKDESCFKCGISCHKNIYATEEEHGRRKPGKFVTKFDYEPLDLLTINLGIYDHRQALEIVELVDQLGFDSISLGVTLGYIMEYNQRHPQQPIVNGLPFGDFHAACRVIEQAAAGQLPEVGQGVKRLSEKLSETAYAMHCKGLELPAYLPETNPGYPFAIAGGHMSMRTFLLLVFDGKTDMDYWVDAIVNKGPYYTRDDVLGLCKFAGAPDKVIEPVFKDLYGVEVTREDMVQAVQRTYLRSLLLERKQGATLDDYVLPARVYQRNPNVQLPHFITPEFWQELRQRVFQAFDAQIESYGLQQAA
ncbi:MAG TPA: aldehyde ferredoxin oxidoreductase C-terminal domain-containing protein [Candidatus Binatia bacterium]|nr:aldehyde ferredoxin oxidoreductase C-terminal domain-containing protein [Candidatus Binatia bacterium]